MSGLEASGISIEGGDAGQTGRRPPTASGPRGRLAELLPMLRGVGFVAAIALVVVIGVRAARHVHPDQITWWPLALALAAAATWWVLLARGWSLLVSGATTAEDMSTWCRTQPLRYLPGGVWAPASRAVVMGGGLLDRVSTVAAENVVALCTGLAVGGAALALGGKPLWLPLVLALVVPTVGLRLLAGRTRLAPDRTRRATVNGLIAFSAYAVAAALVQGAVSGFHHPVLVAGAAAVAWAAGLVVVIAPGGLGVRELAYVALLSHTLPSGELAAAAVTMRIVMVVAELAVLVVVGRPRSHGVTVRAVVAPAVGFVRRHALFLGLFVAGAALRVVAWLAYTPGFVYYDSVRYLNNADHLRPDVIRPLGYPLFLRLLPTRHGLEVIPAVQHLMGLAIAVLIYALVARLGARRWVAALAAAPILLDAYQLVIEEYVLSEPLFQLLLVAGCVALLWRRCPGILGAGIAGVLFAAVVVTRANGLVVMVPVLLTLAFLLWGARARRREGSAADAAPPGTGRAAAVRARLRRRGLAPSLTAAVALLTCFAVPVAGYAAWYHRVNGSYSITGYGGRFLYARVAPFAHCSKLSLPRDERILCPKQPVGQRPTLLMSEVEYYMWGHSPVPSPIYRVPSDKAGQLGSDFAKRVIRHQPLDYLRHVTHDFLRGFAVTRTRGDGELPIARWQFPDHYPIFYGGTTFMLKKYGYYPPHVDRGLVSFLRGYQRFGYTPGPVFVIGLLAGLLAALGVGRARRSGLRSASFLFAALGFAMLASSALANQFTWRYALPELMLLPPAAALGLTALLRRPRTGRPGVRKPGSG